VGARWEVVRQGWRKVWPYMQWPLGVLIVAAAIYVLIYVPKMQVPICPPDQTGLPPKVCFDIENEARKTLAYILGGVLAIIGITLAHRRIRALERQVQIGQEQLQVAQEGQITERFTRTIEQLGSDRIEVRLGGIYALERIANDSDKDYWTIIETFTAYVRERAPWEELSQEAPKEAAGEEVAATELAPIKLSDLYSPPATDIQAVLTVLGRRKYRFGQEEEKGPLDLGCTALRQAFLRRAHLEGVRFMGANLRGADLIETHLERADFKHAHLQAASLQGADLEGADLKRAHLEFANLWEATGLTREQLAVAIIDENTILPDHLQEQPPKAKGPEGNNEE